MSTALEDGASCVHGAALFWLAYYTTLANVVPEERTFQRENASACSVARMAGLLDLTRTDVPARRAQAKCAQSRSLLQRATAIFFALREQVHSLRITGKIGGFVNSKNRVMGNGQRRVAVSWEELRRLNVTLHGDVRALAGRFGYDTIELNS